MTEDFADLITNNKFCVVGNSPKEVGTGNGPVIDSYDIVIRFKNYDISEEFAADYGTKTDIWSTPFNQTQFYRDPAQYRASLCCLPLNIPRWKMRFPRTNIDYPLLGRYEGIIQYIPFRIFEEVWHQYPIGQPSSGVITLYWMYKILGRPLNKKDMFGFSMFDPDEPHHYFLHKEDDEKTEEWRISTPTTHPREMEMKVYEDIIK